MTQIRTFAAVVLVAAVVLAPMAAAVAGGTATGASEPDGNATAPGEKLSGVVSVQGSELDGEMRERTFGARVASAESDAAKAAVVAEEVEDLETRLSELERRKAELQAARENGEISEGKYRAEMAELAAEIENTRRMANHTERVAGELPDGVLAEKGVDVESIRSLSERAANLSGPEVAELARSIAGNRVGRPIAGTERPEDIPGIGNRTDGPGGPGEDPPGDGPGDDPPGDGSPGDDSPGDGGSNEDTPEDASVADARTEHSEVGVVR